MRWIALRTIIEQGERAVMLEEVEVPFQLDPSGPDARVIMRVDSVERAFAIGDHIRFTPDDLLDICLFYQIVIDRVALALAEYARECGVVFNPPQPPADGIPG